MNQQTEKRTWSTRGLRHWIAIHSGLEIDSRQVQVAYCSSRNENCPDLAYRPIVDNVELCFRICLLRGECSAKTFQQQTADGRKIWT